MNAVLIMASGNHFIARPDTVGTTDEELVAIRDGLAAADRIAEVQINLMRSALALEMAKAGGKN